MPAAVFSGANAPAATDFASVMVVFGSVSDVRLSHGVAAEADIAHIIAKGNAMSTREVVFMAAILDQTHQGRPGWHSPLVSRI